MFIYFKNTPATNGIPKPSRTTPTTAIASPHSHPTKCHHGVRTTRFKSNIATTRNPSKKICLDFHDTPQPRYHRRVRRHVFAQCITAVHRGESNNATEILMCLCITKFRTMPSCARRPNVDAPLVFAPVGHIPLRPRVGSACFAPLWAHLPKKLRLRAFTINRFDHVFASSEGRLYIFMTAHTVEIHSCYMYR